MRPSCVAVMTMLLSGCSQAPAVNTPTPLAVPPASLSIVPRPPQTENSGWLWVMVVDLAGVCIPDAIVEIVSGQDHHMKLTQTTPCDAWGYDGGVMFTNLKPGVATKLRASAPGYLTK